MKPPKKNFDRKKKQSLPIDRTFDPPIWADAQRIVAQYQVTLWQEDDRWFGHGLEMPHVYGDGATVAECVASTLEGLVVATAHMIELGDRPPAPAREGIRNE